MRKQILIASLFSLSSLAFSWGDAGHAAIADIAYRHLTPNARIRVNQLLTVGVEKRYQTVGMASFWADEYRSDHEETGPWHYINYHFRQDGRKTTMQPNNANVTWAIKTFQDRLTDNQLTKESHASALRFLMHFVPDAHQPMHAVARDTRKDPTGDRGGNGFEIKPGRNLPSWNTNLHSLWDSGCGAFDIGDRIWEDGAESKVVTLAKKIEKAYPMSDLEDEVKQLDPKSWVNSGFKIAKDFAYTAPEGGTPDSKYIKTAQDICMKRAALAGYRLAAILNKEFDR